MKGIPNQFNEYDIQFTSLYMQLDLANFHKYADVYCVSARIHAQALMKVSSAL